MHRKLKFRTDETNLFFSSDWHVFHDRPWVVEDAGYKSINERADAIAENMNEKVKADDTLFYLGDGFLNAKQDMVKGFINKLKCRNIYYLWGNHENPLTRMYRDEVSETIEGNGSDGEMEIYPWRMKSMPNLILLGDYQLLSVDGKPVALCHFPIDVFDMQQYGGYMLCGHSHYNYRKTRSDYTEGKRLDVGWDGHKKILTWEDIRVIMSGKERVAEDHHK